MYKILVCDDDPDIVSALRIYLENAGYAVLTAADGLEAIAAAETQEVHLALLDVMMPRLDGVAATARLRERFNFPIILLTAKGEEADKVLGLETGADDYITKPFNPVEVLARIKSHLRRFTTLGGKPQEEGADLFRAGGLRLDDRSKEVTVDGEPVSLTPIEYNILKLLIQHPGQVYSTGQIYETVWQSAALGSENTVAVHIRHLREKLEIDPNHPQYIKVVWGLGYKMEKLG